MSHSEEPGGNVQEAWSRGKEAGGLEQVQGAWSWGAGDRRRGQEQEQEKEQEQGAATSVPKVGEAFVTRCVYDEEPW